MDSEITMYCHILLMWGIIDWDTYMEMLVNNKVVFTEAQ